MHLALVLTPVLIVIPLLAFMLPVLFRLLKPCQVSELTVGWFESFQVSSYVPMQGLLAAADFQFLSRQPGFDSSLFRKLRRDRLRIFRQYLNRLISDFNRLHALARLVLSQTEQDQSRLFAKLVVLRLRFSLAIIQVEGSYLACRFGMRPISVASVLQQLEEMSFQLSLLPRPNMLRADI